MCLERDCDELVVVDMMLLLLHFLIGSGDRPNGVGIDIGWGLSGTLSDGSNVLHFVGVALITHGCLVPTSPVLTTSPACKPDLISA
jgi:hypothetical protein